MKQHVYVLLIMFCVGIHSLADSASREYVGSINDFIDFSQRVLLSQKIVFSKPFDSTGSIIQLQSRRYKTVSTNDSLEEEIGISSRILSKPNPVKNFIDHYQLVIGGKKSEEIIWDYEIIHSVTKIQRDGVVLYKQFESGLWPHFQMLDVTHHQDVVWIFYWAEGMYHLDAREKHENAWVTKIAVSLERRYDPTANYKIQRHDSEIRVHFIFQDGSVEQWALQNGKLIKQDDSLK